ncbi:MAG: hypothetical protein EZS28_024088 [Streblomastix strix]|uniref:Uncharacterized protein n=1 Tax=Streblomastix strix TaxID=222440 RepID=A0A5J4VDC3_9EUKA|nr:MAG: hypothetical protein EZS28_024088 [Streblomastix strix]
MKGTNSKTQKDIEENKVTIGLIKNEKVEKKDKTVCADLGLNLDYLIAMCVDGAASMIGCHHSMTSKMKELFAFTGCFFSTYL